MKWSEVIKINKHWFIRKSCQPEYDGGLVYHSHGKGAPGIVLSVFGIIKMPDYRLGSSVMSCFDCHTPIPVEVVDKIKFLYAGVNFK